MGLTVLYSSFTSFSLLSPMLIMATPGVFRGHLFISVILPSSVRTFILNSCCSTSIFASSCLAATTTVTGGYGVLHSWLTDTNGYRFSNLLAVLLLSKFIGFGVDSKSMLFGSFFSCEDPLEDVCIAS